MFVRPASEASSRSSNEEELPFPEPTVPLGVMYCLLNVLPGHLEQRFWRSAAGRQYMLDVDRRAAWLMTLQMLLMVYSTRNWSPEALPTQHLFTAAHIVIIHIQMVAARRANYLAVRPLFVTLLRATHLLEAIAHTTTLSRCTLRPNSPCLNTYLVRVHAPGATPHPPSNVVRSLLQFTASTLPFFHGSILLTPYAIHLPLQLLYLLLIFLTSSVGATHNLTLPPILPSTAALCHRLDSISRFVLTLGSFVTLTPLHLCSTPYAPWLVVLFTQVAVGALLPLSVCYILERRAKHRFLTDEGILWRRAGIHAWLAWLQRLLVAVIVAAGVVMAVWEVVVLSHGWLARWAIPFDWDGADTWWYDQLVGRGDRAQCVATEVFQLIALREGVTV